MRKLFLAESKVRVSLSLATAFFLLAAIVVIKSIFLYDEWQDKSKSYHEWIKSDQSQICKREIYDEQVAQCDFATDEYYHPAIARYSCKALLEQSRQRCRDPGSLAELAKSTWNDIIKYDLPGFLALTFATTVGVFILLTTGRLFLIETHIGWRRISLIIGALGSVLTLITTLLQADRLTDEILLLGFIFTLSAFLLSTLLVLGGRRIYGWIYEGFHQEKLGTEFVQSTEAVAVPSITSSSVPTDTIIAHTPDQVLNAHLEEKKMSRNYLVRHWRGELSLPVSYWINGGVLVGVVTIALHIAISEMGDGNYSLRAISFANIGILLFSVTAWLWSTVGIWRSADHHVARGGAPVWASTARAMVVLGFIAMAGNLSNTILPQLKELTLIAFGSDPLGEIVIKVSENGQSVIATGMLREGSAAEVQKILDAAPGATTLILNSNGGRLFEAQQLAHAVRNRNLDTYVEHQCVSACTYIFLAGRDRAATPNAKIGFHQPSFPGIDADTQRFIIQDMMNVYRAAGLPDAFIQRIGGTSPEDMWYPTREELINANIITHISLGGDTAIFD